MGKNARIARWILPLALLAGCGGAELTVGSALVDLGERIVAVRAELGSHAQEIANQPTVAAMQPFELSHGMVVDAQIHAMDEDLSSIQHCTDASGSPPDVGPMRDALSGMSKERDRHEDAMRHAASVGLAIDEERRHQASMNGWLDQMDRLEHALGCR